ncbi:MAG: threonylcarbamoyl-AMP synthase, partial [Gemmataceae bacterium]|nr:threonylcarbamoyl-AMP synthase [Gemmataceae bacterium]
DGGPCSGGIESTVVDVTGELPRILRPGLISAPMLEAVCGPVEVGMPACGGGEGVVRSPGQMLKHYSPRAEVHLFAESWPLLDDELFLSLLEGEKVGVLEFGAPLRPSEFDPSGKLVCVWMPDDPCAYAARLYAALHDLDGAGATRILVHLPPDAPEWAGVRDRLARAAAR